MKKLFLKSLSNWIARDPFTQSAAAAYYAIFSFPGLMIIFIGIGAVFFNTQSVEQQILSYIASILGPETAHSIKAIIEETQSKDHDHLAISIGLLTLLFGATGLFVQLQHSLNNIWEVEIKRTAPWFAFIINRATSFGMIIAVGFVLLISLAITTAITVFGDWVGQHMPQAFIWVMVMLNIFLSFAIVGFLFSLIFKILPDAKISWKPAIAGGVISSVLFNLGEHALTGYFTIVEPQTTFGAAGSLILIMVWVSYSCMILLLGAEFAKVYMEEKLEDKIKPTEIARRAP